MSENDTERTKSGSPIYRYGEPKRWDGDVPPSPNMEAIDAHVEKYLGPVKTVLHEIASDKVHLDVNILPATEERKFNVLVTSGASDLPMSIPEGAEVYDRIELLLVLPPDWPLTEEAFKDETNYWPIRWLKYLARFPHDHDTWLGWGHTVQLSHLFDPVAGRNFEGVVLHPPYWLDADFFTMETTEGDTVAFYQVVPLYAEELQLKLDEGSDGLEELFEKKNVDFILDPSRKNVATPSQNPLSRFLNKK